MSRFAATLRRGLGTRRPALAPEEGPAFALVGATLLDGTGGPARAATTVIVEHGLVVAVGPDGATPLPRSIHGGLVRDVRGAVVTPGVVDAHVHLAFGGRPGSLARGGVTSARDLGWPPARLAPLVADAWRTGTLVTWAGQMLTAPGGYPTRAAWAPAGTGLEVATVDAAVAAVDAQVAGGATTIKVALEDRVGPLLGPDVLAGIVERAEEWGREVTAHVGSAEALVLALEGGVHELAHVPFAPSAVPARLVEAAAAAVALVPTLRCREGEPAHRDEAVGFVRAFAAAGGRVAYGTDLGNARTTPGVDPCELQLLLDGGLTPAEVVVAATSGAAGRLGPGWRDLVGVVAPGRRADLLVLRPGDDPLADPAALSRPALVVAGGVAR